jgi:PAS domain S-box-containing protein
MQSSKPVRVCLIDDDEDDFILTRDLLKEIPEKEVNIKWQSIDWINSYEKALSTIKKDLYDIYLVDYRLGSNTGIDLLKEAVNAGNTTPIIILTGKGDKEIDLLAMRSGAADYLVKDRIDSQMLDRAIRYALERAEAVNALRNSERKFRNIFERSKDVIFIVDEDGTVVEANSVADTLFNLNVNGDQKNFQQLFIDPTDWHKLKNTVIQQGSVSDFEVQMTPSPEERLTCLISATYEKRTADHPGLIQGIIHDITKRKKAETELRNMEKLAVSGRIARTIAHEVRNPLTNVNLSVEQLRNELGDKAGDLQLYFDIIIRNCERINQLITELLNSAKPATLQNEAATINDIVRETIALAKDRIDLKHIKLVEDLQSSAKVSADKVKLQTALLNIVINAVEAMEENKGVLEICTVDRFDTCKVIIKDNGSGIKKEDVNKLFDPFFSGKPKGMGLGLTTAQNIIFTHKGTIDVESEPGKGTTFVIGFYRS